MPDYDSNCQIIFDCSIVGMIDCIRRHCHKFDDMEPKASHNGKQHGIFSMGFYYMDDHRLHYLLSRWQERLIRSERIGTDSAGI